MTHTLKSRIKVAAIHLIWVTLPIAIYWRYAISPPLRGQEVEALLFCVKVALYQPLLCGVARALLCWNSYERRHGEIAFLLSLFYHGIAFGIFVVCLLMAYTYILLLPAIFVFYLVLPLWLMFGWAISTVVALLALTGAEPESLRPLLPRSLRGSSRDCNNS